MKIFIKSLCISLGLFIFSPTVFALGHFGFTLPIVLISKDPDNVHNYRVTAWYQPEKLTWNQFNIRFAATAGHWWSNGATENRTIDIYAIVPVLHLFIANTERFSPYFELSIGPAYMTKTYFAERNLGIHYTFQDELTLGALFGKDKGFYVAISALHYSNGAMASRNSGITVPMILNLGYQFG